MSLWLELEEFTKELDEESGKKVMAFFDDMTRPDDDVADQVADELSMIVALGIRNKDKKGVINALTGICGRALWLYERNCEVRELAFDKVLGHIKEQAIEEKWDNKGYVSLVNQACEVMQQLLQVDIEEGSIQ